MPFQITNYSHKMLHFISVQVKKKNKKQFNIYYFKAFMMIIFATIMVTIIVLVTGECSTIPVTNGKNCNGVTGCEIGIRCSEFKITFR